ncbi:MAG: hypothetical protein CMG07_02485 [Candidatus Marinimicrobia bacterium]|nr:hypothetical protein [Candidatus Neomarinimicrobiota bacterium]
MLNKYFFYKKNIELKWMIILPVLVLLSISLITLYSTKSSISLIESNFFKQCIFVLFGFIIFYILQYVRNVFFYEMAYVFYFILLILLIITLFMPSKFGASRWILVGPIRFQPSEFGKIIIVFTLSKFLADYKNNINDWKLIPFTLLIASFPAILIFKQPDLGTSIIFPAVTFPMLLWAGVRPFHLFVVISPILSIIAAFNLKLFYSWMFVLILVIFLSQPKVKNGIVLFIINLFFGTLSSFLWNNLYAHQRNRILTFLDPTSDPLGAGYQIIQSITAIGSGGFLGKGFGQGSQTHLRFLPVRDSDFIISVIGEEFGFILIFIVFATFYFLLYNIINSSSKLNNKFGSFALIGFVSTIFFHVIINMGMVVSLFPVTGLPLPFISYGGTFLLTMIAIISIINNIISSDIEV